MSNFSCNSSYVEKIERITKFDAKKANYTHPTMIVVTEWEEFGKKGELDSILTNFDKEIDAASVHQGGQVLVFSFCVPVTLYKCKARIAVGCMETIQSK